MKSKIIIMALLLAVSIGACNKYADGPGLSLRTRTARLSNTWKVENYKVNGADFTSLVTNYTETFSSDGSYSYHWGLLDGTGKWVFQNNDTEVKITGTDNQSSRTLVILKLENKTLWYTHLDGNDKQEYHLIQQ